MIEITKAKFEDVARVREVAIQTFVDTFADLNTPENMTAFLNESYSLQAFEQEFHEEGSTLYIAWIGQRISGFLRLRTSAEAEGKLGSNSVELHRLYVHKDFQKHKIGKALMETALDFATKKNVDWIWLGVWEGNTKAQDFYWKWGFEKFDEHVFQMGDDPQTDWLLRKRIKQ
jgi:diamine N-acetyltransferase